MSTGLTYKIEDGTAVTLPEVVDNLIRGFLWDFRDKNHLTPLPILHQQLKDTLDKAIEGAADIFGEIHTLEGKSDQQLEDELREAIESNAKFDQEFAEKHQLTVDRFEAAEKLLVEWTPPESMHPLKEGMLRHLREQIEYNRRHAQLVPRNHVIPSGAKIREERLEELQRRYASAQDRVVELKIENEKTYAFYVELHAELKRIGMKV